MISILLFVLFLMYLMFLFYNYSTKNHSYWSERNVKHDRPIPLFGNFLRNVLGLISRTEVSVELYNKYPGEKVIGYYYGRTPQLIIKDLDLIRNIMKVDFASFNLRGTRSNVQVGPYTVNTTQLEGEAWKLLRQQLTPALTTAKMRTMFPLATRSAERLQAAVGGGGERDAFDMMAGYTMKYIGACGFGVGMDTIVNKRSHFLDFCKQIFCLPLKSRHLWVLGEIFPELQNVMSLNNHNIKGIIADLVKKIKEQQGYKFKDFIDLMLEFEAKGKMQGNCTEKSNPDGSPPVQVELNMDLKLMVAQIFVIFAASFETSSIANSFTLHALAYNPDIQSKVQKEIDQVMSKYDNKLCYDAIAEMTLLDMTFKESMRMFPPGGVLNRECTKIYTIPELGITIDPGVKVQIPVQAIHMDEQYFDNPREFRPERFTKDAVQARHKYAYLPFGDGPKICPARNLGRMVSLTGLAAILHKFTVEPAATSRWELSLDHTSTALQRVQKLPIVFKLR